MVCCLHLPSAHTLQQVCCVLSCHVRSAVHGSSIRTQRFGGLTCKPAGHMLPCAVQAMLYAPGRLEAPRGVCKHLPWLIADCLIKK